MTTEGPQVRQTIVAANDFRVAGALYKIVEQGGNFAAADDARVAGVALSQANSGQHLTVGISGVFKAYIGAAVASAGMVLKLAASGYLISGTSGSLGVGRALQSGASGDLVRCHLDFAHGPTLTA
jgi:hypothetical protein